MMSESVSQQPINQSSISRKLERKIFNCSQNLVNNINLDFRHGSEEEIW